MTYFQPTEAWLAMAEQNTFDSAYLKALREKRPLSYRIKRGWVTIFERQAR